jgi:hypothetical protein
MKLVFFALGRRFQTNLKQVKFDQQASRQGWTEKQLIQSENT